MRREIGQQKSPDDPGVARGLLGHADAERAQKLGHGFLGAAGFLDGGLQLCQLHLSECQKDVILAGKVVEKGAFADVCSFSDIFDGRLVKSFSCKEIQSCPKQTLASFRRSSFAAPTRIGLLQSRAMAMLFVVFS